MGQGAIGGFECTLYPVNINSETLDNPLFARKKDLAVGGTIAHEVGLHCIGNVSGHFAENGFIDSRLLTPGTSFTTDGAKRFVTGLHLDLK